MFLTFVKFRKQKDELICEKTPRQKFPMKIFPQGLRQAVLEQEEVNFPEMSFCVELLQDSDAMDGTSETFY